MSEDLPVESPRRVECRMCRGLNDPRNAFCEYCGASLRDQGYKETGRKAVGGVLARSVKRLFFVAVIIAVLGAVYYGVDRYLLPVFQSDESPVISVSTTALLDVPTTTTTIPREDKVIAGENRYATAIAISKLGFAGGVPGVVLAGGETYSEAVCAAPLAAAYGGPVLLVPPEGVSEQLAAEIERLNPATVFLVGVSRPTRVKNQVKEVLADADVKNLAGDTAYETAVLIAEEVQAKVGQIEKVVLVPSDSFQEGLAVAPLAAAKGWPILLKPKEDDTPRATVKAIEALGATSVLVVGTTADLDLADVETKAGADVYETCALVASYAAEQGLSFEHTAFATGEDFPDGLAAAPYLAVDNGILLLTKPAALPEAIQKVFNENSEDILRLDFVGLRDLAKTLAASSGATSTMATSTTEFRMGGAATTD